MTDSTRSVRHVGPIADLPTGASAYTSAEQASWQAMKPGIWGKPLYVSADSAQRTLLVRMDPGAESAPHAHDEFEQVYVISGCFEDDECVLGPGDFCCRAPGTLHRARSQHGATVIVVYTQV